MKLPSANRGFTLIELLVVVAVISILAVMATMNFQLAQARAKVSRVHADLRAITLGLEAYRADNQAYPHAAIARGDLLLDNPMLALTTPVAYLTSVPVDPFGMAGFDFNPSERLKGYLYRDRDSTSVGLAGETYAPVWVAMPRAKYLIHSPGPNRIWDVTPYMSYDPTNGAVSRGDISLTGP